MKHIFLIFLCLACFADVAANGNWSNRFISYEDGLPATRVNDIVQDSQGYIWIGSDMGLCRFDGSHLVSFEWLGYGDTRQAANVGNLYFDEKNQLLWVRTRKYNYSCYSLPTGRFLTYGTPEQHRDSYRRVVMTADGIWLCDAIGIRHIIYRDGQLSCVDYRSDLGNLPEGEAQRIAQDAAGNIWGIVGTSIVVITPDGKMTVKDPAADAYRITTWGEYTLFLNKGGKLFMYDTRGDLVRTDQMPEDQCDLGSQNTGFVWNDRWVMLTSRGTHVYDLKTHTFRIDESLQMYMPRMLDSDAGTHFVSASGSLCVFAQGKSMLRLPLLEGMNVTGERNRRFSSAIGADGRYYIATFGNGLFIYDPESGDMEHHTASDAVPLITSDFLTDIFLDKQGNVWLSQEESGVVCLGKNYGPKADIYTPVEGAKGGWRNNVCFLGPCDAEGHMLVSTRDNQYYSFTPATGQFEPCGSLPAAVFAHLRDRQGREWLGTRGDGLYVDGQHYISIDDRHYIPSIAIHDLVEDSIGRVWAATNDAGLLEITLSTDGVLSYRQFLHNDVNTSRISRLFLDGQGMLWITSNGGLFGFDTRTKEVKESSFVPYKSYKDNRPFDELTAACRTADGRLYAGSLGHGVARLTLDNRAKITGQEVIDKHSGLHGNQITSITEDARGNVWVGTSTHISRVDKGTGYVQSFDMPYEIEHAYLTRGQARLLPDGRLIYATSEGLMAIDPDHIRQSGKSPFAVCVTDVTVNGISVYSNEATADFCAGAQLTLPYDHNNLSLTFSNFDYARNGAVYQYWFEGLDKTWNESTTETSVSYDNLAPGRYVFHVRTFGSSDKGAGQDTSLVIVIRQPWWNTWWAWLIYVIAAGFAAWWSYRSWRRRFELQQEIKLQQQMTEFRLEFFTHVTHEFRTPLSIIVGAVDKMSESTPEAISKKTIQTVKRGATRLRQLVDRLMEFRKISTGNVSLQVEQGDLSAFLKDLMLDFWAIAQRKQQTMTFTPFAKQCITYFDRHIVDTIVYNLLSNAVKYTPDGGKITLRLSQGEDHRLLIIVEDSGPGISVERQKDMYSPFMHGHASAGGMGIGLYTAMQMAQTHHGTLQYENTGHGSRFTFALPAGDDAYSAADYHTAKALATDDAVETQKAEEIIRELMTHPMNDLHIAVIEDEPDMLEQLHDELSNYFIVDTYATGKAGVEGIKESKPSLLVCDVMLPDTNGYDIVRQLKAEKATVGIPVILLTALDDPAHQIKGYKAGADDYMVKPCNVAVLVARIAQLIQWNSAAAAEAEEGGQSDTGAGQPSSAADNGAPDSVAAVAQPAGVQVITSQQDRVFLSRLETLVSQHAGESDFSIDALAEMMHMGRTKFYGRCRDLLGMPPNRYVLQVRMTRAGEMLLTGEKTVAEVCYAVGFSDPSHFNKCFKAFYGVPPSKYGK